MELILFGAASVMQDSFELNERYFCCCCDISSIPEGTSGI